MRLSRRTFVAASLAGLAACNRSPASSDILITGGPIYTGKGSEKVSALAISGGKIAFLGDEQAAESGYSTARKIDLKGAALFPGFIDSHAHLLGIGLREMTLSLEGTPTLEDLVRRVRERAQEEGGIISGGGWIETHWPEKRFPTAADLDRAVSDRPVVLRRADGHALVANSKALELGGVTASTPDPAGGQILKGPDGKPTGMLIDNAMGLVMSKVPPPSYTQRKDAIDRAVKLYASRGWTGAHNMSASAEEVATLTAMADGGQLPIRVDNYLNLGDAAEVLKAGQKDHLGRVGARGVKLYMDGALGSRGALLLAPYADAPGAGLLRTPLEDIDAVLKQARASGAQVALHAIGDKGNRLALDAFERAFADDPNVLRHLRWRIEHAQIVDPADLPRFETLGVIASMQPSHAIGDLHFAPARLGPNRLAGAYAWKTLMDSGALVCGGSDAPVEVGDPLIEFYAAAYRHDLQGFAGPDWRLQETLSRDRALSMFTGNAAAAAFREEGLGPLAVGRLADLTAFSVDLMSAPFVDIPKGKAVLTVVDGEVVHNAL